MPTPYPWKRFWIRSGEAPLFDSDGFLSDPEDGNYWLASDLDSLKKLTDAPALLLLGEPGMGKTTSLNEEKERLEKESRERQEARQRSTEENKRRGLDPSEVQEESSWVVVHRRLSDMDYSGWFTAFIDDDEEIRNWKEHSSKSTLFLLLDGLDETTCGPERALRNILNVVKIKRWPRERLRLRITCRKAEWPWNIPNDDNIKELWRNHLPHPTFSPEIRELVPLRRKDVVAAAESKSIDPIRFLAEVKRHNAASLASRPITLEMLLNFFNDSGTFPQNRSELFKEGCLRLCNERNLARCRNNSLLSKQLFVVASRMATLSLLSARYEIQDPSSRIEGDGILPSEKCMKDGERWEGLSFSVNKTSIDETLRTGLFSTLKENDSFIFAHQSYAEFLAAWYLNREVPAKQLLNLLIHPDGTAVIPKFRELATWLLAMESGQSGKPALFPTLLELDPLLFVQVDSFSGEQRRKLFRRLMEETAPGKNPDWEEISDLCRSSVLRNLRYPELANDLRPFISNETNSSKPQRDLALEIARACAPVELTPDLSALLNTPDEGDDLRRRAAQALQSIGTEDAHAALRPFLEDREDDRNRELKGVALDTLWPQFLTAEKFFSVLTPPQPRDWWGTYRRFLSRSTSAFAFTTKDVCLAGLRWMKNPNNHPDRTPVPAPAAGGSPDDYEAEFQTSIRRNCDHSFDDIMTALLQESVRFLADTEVSAAYAAVLPAYYQHRAPCPSGNTAFETTRENIARQGRGTKKQLLSSLVEALDENQERNVVSIFRCINADLALASADDLGWLIQQAQNAFRKNVPGEHQNVPMRNHWMEIACVISDLSREDHIRLLLRACEELPLFAEKFPQLMENRHLPPCEIVRKLVLEAQDTLDRPPLEEPRRTSQPSLQKRIAPLLDRIETGETALWPQLVRALYRQEQRTFFSLVTDLTKSPGWTSTDPQTQRRILAAAQCFLQHDTLPERKLGERGHRISELSVGSAFFLLEKQHHDFLDSMETKRWEKWIPFLLDGDFSARGEANDETETIGALLRKGYEKAPEICRHVWHTLLQEQTEDAYSPDLGWQLRNCLDEPIREFLRQRLSDNTVPIGGFRTALLPLLEQRDEESIRFVEKLLLETQPGDESGKQRAVAALQTLMNFPTQGNWDVFRSLLGDNSALAVEAVPHIADGALGQEEIDFFSSRYRTAEELAHFYLWLCRNFPLDEDPAYPSNEAIRRLQQNVLDALVSLGSPEAVRALEQLREELPDLDFLQRARSGAYRASLEKTWIPPTPDEIGSMLENANRRLVYSPEQLLEALLDSLQRMEDDLQGETPGAVFLWNECNKGENGSRRRLFHPKAECYLSDAVARHLRKDLKESGVIVNREVEIRGSYPPGSGKAVDICVSATSRPPSGTPLALNVIIEVKGSWHRDTDTAMGTQLAERYLVDSSTRHGIYLMGWFDCDPVYFHDHTNKKPRPWTTIENARAALEKQAQNLNIAGERTVRAFVMDVSLSKEWLKQRTEAMSEEESS